MNESTNKKLNSTNIIINLFSEKSELLAVKSFELFNKKEDISKIIGMIILHQSAELILKASCLDQNIPIYEKEAKTITFGEAVRRNSNNLNMEEKFTLQVLNNKRNAFQHDAMFDVSDEELNNSIFMDSLNIVLKLCLNIDYDASELNLLLNNKITG